MLIIYGAAELSGSRQPGERATALGKPRACYSTSPATFASLAVDIERVSLDPYVTFNCSKRPTLVPVVRLVDQTLDRGNRCVVFKAYRLAASLAFDGSAQSKRAKCHAQLTAANRTFRRGANIVEIVPHPAKIHPAGIHWQRRNKRHNGRRVGGASVDAAEPALRVLRPSSSSMFAA